MDKLEKKIKDLVPEDSFLDSYFKWSDQGETPFMYDVWSGLWCLSNAVSRSAIVDRPNAPVHLNLYIVLAANSGVTRKTTSVMRATEVLREAAERHKYQIQFVQAKASKEKIEGTLHDSSKHFGYSHVAFSVPEFVSLVGREMYAVGMPGFLTDIYDSAATRETVGTVVRGSGSLRNVYATLLAASTPNWLIRAINPQIIEGGFTSRCFFIFEEDRKRSVPWADEDSTQLRQQSINALYEVFAAYSPSGKSDAQNSVKRIRISDYALRRFKNWYNAREENFDPFLASFDAREDAHILKVAALFAINAGLNTIDEPHIAIAEQLVAAMKLKAASLLSYQTGGELVNQIDKLRNILVKKQNSGIMHTDLVRQMNHCCKAQRLNTLLNIMHSLGMVRRFMVKDSRKSSTVWVAEKPLWQANFFEAILEKMEGTSE